MNILQPGFIAFHSNRSEELAQVLINWIQRHPLNPLEEEVILVQSNGMAEWLKMELARRGGVCAATRVELPSRFLWRTYRQVLGRESVPAYSALDKLPMTWRFMQLLPTLIAQPYFAPVAGFLQADEPDRMLQLASKLADLFDQYQIYRADWLAIWESGKDQLQLADGRLTDLPAEQRWQPQLWRAVLSTLDERERQSIRPQLHQRAVQRLQSNEAFPHKVAQRVIVFGMSHMPYTTLEALAALSAHSQVMLAIPNPCQFYWGDIMDGRELLRAVRRRQPLRENRELAGMPLEDMHAHAHPLLAAWGRQSRDFIRQLDVFDDEEQSRRRFDLPRIDLFDDTEEDADTPLLKQVQNRIRDLSPLSEHQKNAIAATDKSIVFHSAHSPVRELEVLHDQLLHLLANTADAAHLNPRDVIVMVPDIEKMAPAIRAVFGQYKRHDPRYIPFDIADTSAKLSSPLIGAVEWLLRLPEQRCLMSELVDLLEVPAVAARFGIDENALPKLTAWMAGAGIRWGLNAEHRKDLGLDACGEQNSAWFGLHRMLLGFASGAVHVGERSTAPGIEPYDEIGGLDAELAGSLAHLLQALVQWWAQAVTPATPAVWIERGRALLAAMIKPVSDIDRQALSALEEGLAAWQSACEQAGFSDAVPLMVARSAWLSGMSTPSLNQRFRAGGITFCTLMPMRAIPFEVVCLLGMNDGDYPRRSMRSDFDLMALPGTSRPGDRSRRDDDRQLMLESLLSARQLLYVSWCGQSVRDNSEQAPSVLVSQLRDYLSAGWGEQVVKDRTTRHPLQAFSRRYFEKNGTLLTYAREWRDAHSEKMLDTAAALPAYRPDPDVPLNISQLTNFLRNPVKAFFKQRLLVAFENDEDENDDEECFSVDKLAEYKLIKSLCSAATAKASDAEAQALAMQSLASLRRAGDLPFKGFGDLKQADLQKTLTAMLHAWFDEQAQFPEAAERHSVRLQADAVVLEDWIDQLRYDASSADVAAWLELEPGNLCGKTTKPQVRVEKLLGAWVRSLAMAASGLQAKLVLVGRDSVIEIAPMAQHTALDTLTMLLALWQAGMNAPLPLPFKTALTLATQEDENKARTSYEGAFKVSGEGEDSYLSRMYPDYESLAEDGRFELLAKQVYGPMKAWASTQVTARLHASGTAAEPATEPATEPAQTGQAA
jgi:exodeoxyribonuclease V gamma subunit